MLLTHRPTPTSLRRVLPLPRFFFHRHSSRAFRTPMCADAMNNTTTSLADRIGYEHSTRKFYGIRNGIPMMVQLNETEEKICTLLSNVSNHIAKERPELPRIVARIAGGWVRDKLLGKECHDLDVAINDMMGYEFAQYVNGYLAKNGVPTRSIAKIDSNPAKSKHLETATTKLFGQEVDFANLRTEVYDKDSRIPTQITFGTPEQDAERRDTTINSLFYNVDTRTVEDYTKKGLSDLQDGVIRTPLAPFETFWDDPLRVLRCVRFASRFGFKFTPELVAAAKNKEIKQALITKISKERIGIELDKMIRGPSPLYAIRLLHDLGLYDAVFAFQGEILSGQVQDFQTAVKATGAVQWLREHPHDVLRPESTEELRVLYLGASTIPYLHITTSIKNRPVSGVQLILRDSIKATNLDITTISTIFQKIPSIADAASRHQTEPLQRGELGMLIRNIGSLWRTCLKLAMISELLVSEPDQPWATPEALQGCVSDAVCLKYAELLQAASAYGITDCYNWKPMMDGKKIANALGIKPGPVVASLLQDVMHWQLDHPNGTLEECAAVVKTFYDQKSS